MHRGTALGERGMNRSIIRVACRGVFAALLLPLAATAAPGDPLGPETRINTPGAPDGIYAGTLARNASGFMVASWEAHGPQGYGLYVQRLDAGGAPLATEQLVPGATNAAAGPVIALQDSGAFVLTWTEPGASSAWTQVMARRFDAAGNAVGPVLAVSGVESKAVHGNQAVAIAPNGDFAVAWSRKVWDLLDLTIPLGPNPTLTNTSSSAIMFRRYRADGTPVAEASRIAAGSRTYTPLIGVGIGRLLDGPAVALRGDGQAWLTWSSLPYGKQPTQIRLQRLAADGKTLGTAALVGEALGVVDSTLMDLDAQNNAVIAWLGGGSGRDVQLRRYDSAGQPRGEVMTAHTPSTEYGSRPQLAVAPGGSFVVGWTRKEPGDQWPPDFDAQARRFGADGQPLAPEFRVNTQGPGHQALSGLGVDGAGNPAFLLRNEDPALGLYLKHYEGP